MVINSCRLALPAAPAPGPSSLHLDKAEGSLKITLRAVTHGICRVGLKGAAYRSPEALNQGEGQRGAAPRCGGCSRDARCALHKARAPNTHPPQTHVAFNPITPEHWARPPLMQPQQRFWATPDRTPACPCLLVLNSGMKAGDEGLNMRHHSFHPSSSGKPHHKDSHCKPEPPEQRGYRWPMGCTDAAPASSPARLPSRSTHHKPPAFPLAPEPQVPHTHTPVMARDHHKPPSATPGLPQPRQRVAGAGGGRQGVNHTPGEAPEAFVETRILSL